MKSGIFQTCLKATCTILCGAWLLRQATGCATEGTAEYADCGGERTGMRGTISSPGYADGADYYPPNVFCTWTITTVGAVRIQVRVLGGGDEHESDAGSCQDQLTVSSGAAVRRHPLCGGAASRPFDVGAGSVTVTYCSGSRARAETGFELAWKPVYLPILENPPKTCNDVYCHPHANCRNRPIGPSCKCKDGYAGDGRRNCVDINECKQQPLPCHENATCTNGNGYFRCKCKLGFTGDGRHCEAKARGPTRPGACQMSTCGKRLSCITNPRAATHYCVCRDGFVGDGRTCADVNECEWPTQVCTMPHARCENTPGSYVCYPPNRPTIVIDEFGEVNDTAPNPDLPRQQRWTTHVPPRMYYYPRTLATPSVTADKPRVTSVTPDFDSTKPTAASTTTNAQSDVRSTATTLVEVRCCVKLFVFATAWLLLLAR